MMEMHHNLNRRNRVDSAGQSNPKGFPPDPRAPRNATSGDTNPARTPTISTREVGIPVGRYFQEKIVGGTLRWSDHPRGVILFVHGSGSSRFSPRNAFVAAELNKIGFATLLLDLLTEEEALDRENVFDIPLLAERVGVAMHWLLREPVLRGCPVGLFGASTGAAAALVAAARHAGSVFALVSRGGRTDLAWDSLHAVLAPTLFIVGGEDEPVLAWNRQCLARLNCPKQLAVIPHATHLFEEPGTLEQVAELAQDWFSCHLPPVRTKPGPPK